MKTIYIFILVIILNTFSVQTIRSQVFWDERNSGVTVSLNSVSNYDNVNAWICGDSGTVIRTSNNGYNWINLTNHGIPTNVKLINIYGINATSALTAGYKDTTTYVYRTTNSGTNWTQVFMQLNGRINSIFMKNDSVGFMEGNPVGTRWSLWKTTNRGANWDSIGLYLLRAGTETGYPNSLWMIGNKIWFGTNNTRIYYSDSSGFRWYIRSTSPELNIYSLIMNINNSQTGYCAGSAFYKTANEGTNWVLISVPGSGNILGITGRFETYFNIWYARGNSIGFSSNGSTGWYISYTAPSGIYNHMCIARTGTMYGPGYIYAVRNNGLISRANAILDAIRLISNEVPSEYKLFQNYPNPFNSSTKVKFDSRKLPSSFRGEVRGGHIHLIVYDIQGREAAVLENTVVQPGTYEATWNAGNSPSGIYFCRLLVTDPNSTGVVYSEIIKLMLIK